MPFRCMQRVGPSYIPVTPEYHPAISVRNLSSVRDLLRHSFSKLLSPLVIEILHTRTRTHIHTHTRTEDGGYLVLRTNPLFDPARCARGIPERNDAPTCGQDGGDR